MNWKYSWARRLRQIIDNAYSGHLEKSTIEVGSIVGPKVSNAPFQDLDQLRAIYGDFNQTIVEGKNRENIAGGDLEFFFNRDRIFFICLWLFVIINTFLNI